MHKSLRLAFVLTVALGPCLMADDRLMPLDDRFTVEGCYKVAKDKARRVSDAKAQAAQAAQAALEYKYARKAAVERYVQAALEVRKCNPPAALRHPLFAKAYRAKQARAAQLYTSLRAKQQAMHNSNDSGETSKLRLEINDVWVQLRDIYRELLDNTTNTDCVTALLRNLARS